MKYKYSEDEAAKISQFGIDLTIYPTDVPTAKVVRVSVKEGHFQEFYNTKSTFIYTILEGGGTFCLNDEMVPAKLGDQLVIPPEYQDSLFRHHGNGAYYDPSF